MNAPASSAVKASFPVRRMDFEFDEIPRYWFHNDPFLSHLLNGLSALFPDGERFFVDSIRAVRDQITDPVLQKEISAFIGQEAMHSKEHAAFNRYADAHQIDIATLEQRVGTLLDFAKRRLPKMHQLAITCALEHFTATIAGQLLRRKDWNERLTDPTMRKMWLWHAIEENEHKAVAFDAYQQLGGGYLLRAFYMAVATVGLLIMASHNIALLLKADGKLVDYRWGKWMWWLFGPRGFFSELVVQYMDYFRPDFHPNDHDTKQLEAAWKERLSFA